MDLSPYYIFKMLIVRRFYDRTIILSPLFKKRIFLIDIFLVSGYSLMLFS